MNTRERGTADQRTMIRPSSPQFVSDSDLLKPAFELNRNAAGIRDVAEFVHQDISHLHGRTQNLELGTMASSRLKDGIPALLEELSEARGVGWSQLARLIGVSVPAVRKWRMGQADPSPENRMLLAKLCAFFDLLARDCIIQDPAGWLEAPINETMLSGLDLYLTRDGAIALLEFAGGRMSADQLLDRQVPEWRARHTRDPRFRVETAGDGQRSIIYDPDGGSASRR